MKRFKNLLFVHSPSEVNIDALQQALELAKENQAALTIVLAVKNLPRRRRIAEAAEADLMEHARQSLDAASQRLGNSGSSENHRILVLRGEPFVEIIRRVMDSDHDLIIKAAESGPGGRKGFESLDLHLLRKCPCPVWLHRPRRDPDSPFHILAAIDPVKDDQESTSMSQTILELATSLQERKAGAHLDVLHAWELEYEDALRNSALLRVSSEELDMMLDEAEREHRDCFERMVERFGLDPSSSTLLFEKGEPKSVIARKAVERKADLLLMGTVARCGVPGLLIGNTAETVLGELNCSVMTTKPSGFKCPVV